MSINRSDARQTAEKYLKEIEKSSGHDLVLLDGSTIQIERGWVFFYNSAKYMRTKEFSARLVGNGPLFVALDGALTRLPASRPWEDSIKDIE